jgi:hypothetical protein
VIPRLRDGSVPPATGHPSVLLVAPKAINDVAEKRAFATSGDITFSNGSDP